MPTALYLYNSSDTASIAFCASLQKALSGQGWELLVDYNGGLDGFEGPALGRIAQLMGEVEVIVYAIGPLGPGPVQGAIEAEAALLAKMNRERSGGELKLIPVLVGGAEFKQIPAVLTPLATQADNLSRGGKDALTNVLRAMLGEVELEQRAPESAPKLTDLAPHVERLSQLKRGLTLFISPYAVSDVHSALGPGDIGRKLLVDQLPFLEIDDLMCHPWVAVAARALLDGGRDRAWEEIRQLLDELPPLPLHDRIADLAMAWSAVRPASLQPQARYDFGGLLLVTTDLDMRLERALWNRHVNFGRLRFTGPEDKHTLRTVYERPLAQQPLAFEQVQVVGEGPDHVETTASGRSVPNYEPVMVVKLLDCVSSESCPPLTAIQMLRAIQGASMPEPMPRHLQKAPFVMLGGGLLHPLVSFALATHFLPNFERASSEDEVPRYFAMHSSPGAGDKLRRFERECIEGRRRIYGLERLNCDIKLLLAALKSQTELNLKPKREPA